VCDKGVDSQRGATCVNAAVHRGRSGRGDGKPRPINGPRRRFQGLSAQVGKIPFGSGHRTFLGVTLGDGRRMSLSPWTCAPFPFPAAAAVLPRPCSHCSPRTWLHVDALSAGKASSAPPRCSGASLTCTHCSNSWLLGRGKSWMDAIRISRPSAAEHAARHIASDAGPWGSPSMKTVSTTVRADGAPVAIPRPWMIEMPLRLQPAWPSS